MNSVIVAGATGFVGKYLVNELCKRKIRVVALVREGGTQKIHKDIPNSELITYVVYNDKNILELDKVIPCDRYDAFVNLAWAGVGGRERSDYELQLNNVKRALDFMQLAKKINCVKFLGISSISEYDSAVKGAKDGALLEGRHIYASAKLTTHYMAKSEATLLNIEYINVMLANLFGEEGLDSIIIHDTILKLLKKEPTSFTSGEQVYDFLYVKDAVEGIIRLIENGRNLYSYYVGSGEPRPLKEYLSYLGKLVAPDEELGFGKFSNSDVGLPIENFSIDKLVNHTGYVVRYPYEESIRGVIEYYKNMIKMEN